MSEKYANVQNRLRYLHSTNISWSFMAKESGLSATTIKKFANNETQRPQFHTVDMLADYAGFRIAISHLGLKQPLKLVRTR